MNIPKGLLALITMSFALSSVAQEKYDYIEAPQPKQVADLQDDDRDGVINARDKCAGTKPGSEIDNDGCGSRIKSSNLMQLKVLFANDSASINPVFKDEIKTMIDFLGLYPDTAIELQGYASKVGNAEHNMALSKRRASQVRENMISTGIDPSRVTILGFGDTSLDEKGDSVLSHALNRKVVATVVGYDDNIVQEWNIYSKRKK